MKRVLFSLVLVVVLISIAIAGCTTAAPAPAPTPTPSPTPAPAKTLDIGIAVPLTGPAAHLGTHIQNAILLAIDDQNNEGGVTIAGQKYMLNSVIRDTKFDTMIGKTVAEELVFDKGVKVIAGPFVADAIGAQSVTEPNKVILFGTTASIPGICAPDKPYSFFPGGFAMMALVNGAAYIQKFYPEAKTVVSMNPDLPDSILWLDSVQKVICPRYGLDWLGAEQYGMDTQDFMPMISRALAKKPDILDTSSTGGTMGGMCCLLIKQLRESGYNGIIWSPTVPPPGVMEEVVPEKYRVRIVTNDIVVDSPIVSQVYRDMYKRYMDKFGAIPIDIVGEIYNGVKPFFQFLDGQNTMDTTAWMEGFANYRWQGMFGHEGYWVGKPIFGINRILFRNFWVSEYIDGKLETNWEAPIPVDLFVGE